MTANNNRMGPFGMMDAVGLDVVCDIETIYYRDSKDPKDFPHPRLKQKINRGELGVKTQHGFLYSHPSGMNI